MKPTVPADSSPPGRRRDAGRAALYCGLYVGAVLGLQVAGNGPGAATVGLAFLFWGAAGAAAWVAVVALVSLTRRLRGTLPDRVRGEGS
jgi:hypothetical protein